MAGPIQSQLRFHAFHCAATSGSEGSWNPATVAACVFIVRPTPPAGSMKINLDFGLEPRNPFLSHPDKNLPGAKTSMCALRVGGGAPRISHRLILNLSPPDVQISPVLCGQL
jgi:hypothetical protein